MGTKVNEIKERKEKLEERKRKDEGEGKRKKKKVERTWKEKKEIK